MTSTTNRVLQLLTLMGLLLYGLASAQTPSCVGKHTAREQCECMGRDYDPKLKPVPGCVVRPHPSEAIMTANTQALNVLLADPCGLPAVLHANGKCYQSYTITKPAPKAVCVYADHGQTATIKCTWKPGGK